TRRRTTRTGGRRRMRCPAAGTQRQPHTGRRRHNRNRGETRQTEPPQRGRVTSSPDRTHHWPGGGFRTPGGVGRTGTVGLATAAGGSGSDLTCTVGVTAFDGTDSGPVPAALLAATVKV